MTLGRLPSDSGAPSAADARPRTLASGPWDVVVALAPLAGHGDGSLDLLLAVALQGLLFRYTRGEAELAVRVAGVELPCVVAADRSLLEALGLAARVFPMARRASVATAGGLTVAWDEAAGDGLRLVATLVGDAPGLATRFSVSGPETARTAAWSPDSLGAHWAAFLQGFAASPGAALSRLPLLDDDERELIAGPLSGGDVAALPPEASNLGELFERQVAARPDHPAVECGGVRLTYDELDRRANQLANHLRYKGVRRGDTVGLYMPRGADVYVGILGILKAGAAYVPIDPDYPPERVFFILTDAKARAVVTSGALAARTPVDGPETIALDRDWDRVRFESERLLHADGARLDDPAYVIYTSGSTGLPKGVLIEHRNALAFVRAEAELFQVRPADRVYQGFSVAFDASVEELWLALNAGATLVGATADVVRSGPGVAAFLAEQRVTVLSTVPTLLMMLEDPLPDVRLLILGGEECTAELVRRFSRPGRRLVNTYGPTEATVVATSKDTVPGRKVTIGRPLPGVRAFIVDAGLEPLPIGLAGELCLAGPGLARGYVGRDELTAERFVLGPAALGGLRLYRTGDLARFNEDGELEFLGRIDSQVKLRGFRIELGEIEARLAALPGVRNAAVMVRDDAAGLKQLVAYVVPGDEASLDAGALRAALRERLPVYMVPAHVVVVAEFPTLPSGKVDKKRLPKPGDTAGTGTHAPRRAPVTGTERSVHEVWARLFHPEPVGLDDDFFALGGHSLLATRLLSELRRDERFGDASVLDVYEHPSLEAFCRRLDERAAAGRAEAAVPEAPAPAVGRGAYALCLLLQAAGLYGLFGLFALNWLVPLAGYVYYVDHPDGGWRALALALGGILALIPTQLALGVLVKWTVVGRFKAGRYPVWSVYYWRFWLTRRALSLFAPTYLRGTPFLAVYYRLLGARIGRDVHLGTAGFLVTDLLTIGDGASLDADAQLPGYALRDGWLILGPVTIGAGASIGARSVVELGATVAAGAELDELTLVPEGVSVGAGERWAGAPGRRIGSATPSAAAPKGLGPVAYPAAFVAAFLLGATLPLAAAAPGALFSRWVLGRAGFGTMLASLPVAVATFVVAWCALVVAVKWALVGRVRPGTYSLRSGFYVRLWCVDELLAASLDLVFPLHATLYLTPFLRALGMRVGRGAEVSTAAHYQPDLVELGDGSFLADHVSLGAPRTRGGLLTLGRVRVGDGAFVGNSAVLTPGTSLGDDALLGCQTRPPLAQERVAEAGSSWLGSPGLPLPRRQTIHQFDEAFTFHPSRWLVFLRLAIEFGRITLPETLAVALGLLLVRLAEHLYRSLSGPLFFSLVPFLAFGLAWSGGLATAALKWLLVGRYRPSVKPLWSSFVWRTEVVDALNEQLAAPLGLFLCLGTPLVPLYFRLLGARIGRRVVMETLDLTEYDLVDVGDHACLDAHAGLQTHLFEDRVMKMDWVTVGERCSVGQSAIVLYDGEMRAGSSLGGLSLLMKGEVLPPGTRWQGSPLVQRR